MNYIHHEHYITMASYSFSFQKYITDNQTEEDKKLEVEADI